MKRNVGLGSDQRENRKQTFRVPGGGHRLTRDVFAAEEGSHLPVGVVGQMVYGFEDQVVPP